MKGDAMSDYLRFERTPTAGTTVLVRVENKRTGFVLGVIRWHGAWRQYAYFPTASEPTLYSAGCLKDIQAQIEALMAERRLAQAKQAVAAGKFVIRNAAATVGGRAVRVRGFHHKTCAGGLLIEWSRPGVGFGSLTLKPGVDGRLAADTERMDDEFCLDVLGQALAEREEIG